MTVFYIRTFNENKDVARTYTLGEALHVAINESQSDYWQGDRMFPKLFHITHNRKRIAYVQGDCIVPHDVNGKRVTMDEMIALYQ